MKKNKKSEISFLSKLFFRILIIAGILLLFFIFYKLSQQIYHKKSIDTEIASLQEEIEKLNQKNSNLKELIDYFQTEQYKEKEAREKLGLVREGEEVIEVREKEKIVKKEEEKKDPDFQINQPSYYYWWHYFFKIE